MANDYDGSLVVGVQVDTKQFDRQIDKVEDELFQIDQKLEHAKELKLSEKDIEKLKEEAEKLNNKLVDLNKQKEKWNQQEYEKIDLNSIGNATENVIKKVIKWGLALFSIRSAYNFIRGSVSLLAQDNEQLGADIEYIRWALANTLQPIIETIINLAFTLLQYINYIANAWFGVNLFANQSAEAFKKAKDNVKGTNKEAKKLQKTLAGFDEMNILQENGTTKGGGGGGIALPSTDLARMLPDIEIPGWIEWIATHKDEIIDAIIMIGTAFATWKLLDLVTHMKFLGDGLKIFGDNLTGVEKIVQGFGIALIFLGVYDAVKRLLDLVGNFDWNNLWNIVKDLGIAFEGLGLVLTTLNASNPLGWITLGIGAIGTLIGSIGDLLTEENKEKDALERQKEAADKLKEARDRLSTAYGEYGDAVKRQEKTESELHELEKKHKLSGEELYKMVKNNYKAYKDFSPEQRKVYDAYLANEEAMQKLDEVTQTIIDSKKEETTQILKENEALIEQHKFYNEDFNEMISQVRNGEMSWEEFGDKVAYMIGRMENEERAFFLEKLPDDIEQGCVEASKDFELITRTARREIQRSKENFDYLSTAINNTMSEASKVFENKIPNSIDKTNKAVSGLKTSFQGIGNLIGRLSGLNIKFSTGGVGYAKGGIVTRLATGGIVNRPGRGVPVASASMGEAGREGILPLTDAQAMETLGQAIGRYISINATIPVSVGNRQIAREIRKIEAEDDFAYNG